jgi:hypothetical protein
MTKRQARQIYNHLIKLSNGMMPSRTLCGICYEIHTKFGMDAGKPLECYTLVSNFALGWKHHTGDISYPVPDKDGCNLWTGNSGKLRRSLCRYIAKKIKTQYKLTIN